MKPAIDDLLDTVSGGDTNHPVFGKRYSGDMDEDDFLWEVEDYVIELRDEISMLKSSDRPTYK